MIDPTSRPPPDDDARSHESPRPQAEGGVADALRTAIERTMAATAGSATVTRERAAELVDEVVRRGQEAGAELARRGQDATGELARRLEALEARLVELERALESDPPPPGAPRPPAPDSKPEAEG